MNNNKYNEILRQENELTKLKLQAEFGCKMSENSNLNPAIENIWLNNILEFERAWVNNKPILIKEFLENPDFKSVNEIKDDDLTENLAYAMELLRKKNIIVESLDGIDDKELYRFITEELILEEINPSMPKNMLTVFIYEEFYPNNEADIKRNLTDFMNTLSDKENDRFTSYIASSTDEEKEVVQEKLKLRLNLFRDAFDKIQLNEFEISDFTISDKKAHANINFNLSVLPPSGNKFQIISGSGTVDLINEYDYWTIEKIEMPGVV